MSRAIALLVLTLAACGPALRGTPHARPSAHARPIAYALELTVDPVQSAFSGAVRIEVELERELDEISLHARNLEVGSARVVDPHGRTRLARWEQARSSDIGSVVLPSAMGPGRVQLELHYRGTFASDRWGEGLYRTDVDGHWYAVTQFEPTAARRAFPCFDEPRFRARFQLSLVIPSGNVASANASIDRREDWPNGWMRIHFRETEPLPTHVLGWAVGPFDVVSNGSIDQDALREHRVTLRAFAPPGAGPYARALLDEARRVVPAIERALGVPYPFTKLDVVLAPRLPVGGMENAAHVTLRLRRAHAAAGQLDEPDRLVLTHELAHQWLGVLASTARWQEQWVKEAMTVWLTEHVRVRLDGEPDGYRRSLVDAFDAASIDSSSVYDDALYASPSSPDLREIIDHHNRFRIARGASLLHAFARWIGADAMARGMGGAVRERAWRTAQLDDYLAAMGRAGGQPELAAAYRSFVDQPGIPTVSVTMRCDSDPPALRLRQSRYRVLGSHAADTRWSIPVCVRHGSAGGAAESCVLLHEAERVLPLEEATCPAWAVPNAGGQGYYWMSLGEAGPDGSLEDGWTHATLTERLSMLESMMMSVEDGSVGADALIARVPSLLASSEGIMQHRVASFLSVARNFFVADAHRAEFDRVVSPMLTPLYDAGGWEDTPARVLTYLALEARDPRVRAEGAALGRHYLEEPEVYEPYWPGDPREVAIAVAIQEGDAAFGERVLERASTARYGSTRGRLWSALALSDDPALADRAMTTMLASPELRGWIAQPLWRRLRIPGSRAGAWRWALASLGPLATVRGRRSDPVAKLRAMCDETAARELAGASTLRADPRLTRIVASIRACAAIARDQTPRVHAYLRRASRTDGPGG